MSCSRTVAALLHPFSCPDGTFIEKETAPGTTHHRIKTVPIVAKTSFHQDIQLSRLLAGIYIATSSQEPESVRKDTETYYSTGEDEDEQDGERGPQHSKKTSNNISNNPYDDTSDGNSDNASDNASDNISDNTSNAIPEKAPTKALEESISTPRHHELHALGEPPKAISTHQTPAWLTSQPVVTEKPLPPVVKKVAPSAKFRNEHFCVSKSAIAGWGAFAAKDLHHGDVILRERALFVARNSTLFREFGRLSARERDVGLSLHAHSLSKGGTPRLDAVWGTNCFDVGNNKAGLFAIAARFNHACHPSNNVEYNFDSKHNCLQMTVRAEKIAAGEELKISYGIDRTPAQLYLWYGFACRCGSCKGLSEQEVKRLTSQW